MFKKIKIIIKSFQKKIKSSRFFSKNRKKMLLGVIILFVVLVLYLARSLFFVAFVNYRPILRLSVLKEAEKQSGSTVLNNLVDKALILEEARKNSIKITDDAIDEEIAKIEEALKVQNITLETALSMNNQDMKFLKEQIFIQKIIEEIIGKDIVVSDDEAKTYYETNKEYFDKTKKFEDLKDQIKSELFNQKLSESYNSWIDSLRSAAKIKYFVEY